MLNTHPKFSTLDATMKKLLLFALLLCSSAAMTSCLDDDNDNPYGEWRESNDNWVAEQEALKNPDGTPYYTKVTASWNPNAYVLMHWHNDRSLTAGEITPISTSTTDIKYRLTNYQGLPCDSSYLRTSPADSIYRSQVNANVEGWVIGVTNMHVGDSVTMIIPYQWGYNATARGALLPYSTLVFDLKLKAVPGFAIPAE